MRLDDVEAPRVRLDDDVIVEVQWAGLCRTDAYVASGKLAVTWPRVLGHEFSGRVLAAGDGAGYRVGDPVACMPVVGCGGCNTCLGARPDRCAEAQLLGVHQDGAFAEQVRVPARSLRPLPHDFDLQRAAYAEPLAAALAVLEVGLDPASRGVVLGEGRIAELTHRVMQAQGLKAEQCQSAAELRERGAFDFVVECCADAEMLAAAVHALRPAGTLVLKSRAPEPLPLPLGLCVSKQLRLQGAAYGSFDEAVRWLLEGRIEVQDLFGPAYALSDYQAMFEAGARGEPHKLFLRPGT